MRSNAITFCRLFQAQKSQSTPTISHAIAHGCSDLAAFFFRAKKFLRSQTDLFLLRV
jgi:hypothetical protein